MQDETGTARSAFEFHGSWQEFAPIAFTNLLLTIVTLGFYRFWATTRERQYLWSKTEFIDQPLEWTGRGIELFIGFLLVSLLLGLPLFAVQFITQGLIFRGEAALAGLMTVILLAMIFYLTGVALFRALRYRLSRTYWRGIRGGSDDPGFKYGLSYILKTIASWFSLFLLVPWSMTSLWNERWNRMSFGPYHFRSDAQWSDLMKRYMLFYLVPIAIAVAIIYMAINAKALTNSSSAEDGVIILVFAGLIVIGTYILLPLVALLYYSKFFRVAVGSLKLHNLEFDFKARSADWVFFFLGNLGLIIFTFGIGYIFLPYRNWRFFATHMEVYGEVNLDDLTQSATASPTQGEGLLDAFDVGAF